LNTSTWDSSLQGSYSYGGVFTSGEEKVPRWMKTNRVDDSSIWCIMLNQHFAANIPYPMPYKCCKHSWRSTSHSRIVLSSPPEQMCRSSGLNSADLNQFRWPVNVIRNFCLCTSQILMVLSSEPVSKNCPS